LFRDSGPYSLTSLSRGFGSQILIQVSDDYEFNKFTVYKKLNFFIKTAIYFFYGLNDGVPSSIRRQKLSRKNAQIFKP
jgi:hypothetical protein